MREKIYVYCHTHKETGKKYFGVTGRDPHRRWGNNGCNYKSSPHFYSAIQKYGWDAFYHDVLLVVENNEKAGEIERELIVAYKTYLPQYGYNIELGGNFNGKHSKETCRRISESKIGKPRSEETKKKVSVGLIGKMVGSKNAQSKPVICITTGITYESQGIASRSTGVDQGDISKCCAGKAKSAGKLPTGEKLVWRYYQEE